MKLTKKEYKERLIDKKIDEYLKIFGAISIEGPKWCGKTWTALNHSNSASFLNNTVDNFREKHLAEMDVNLVLDGEFPRTIGKRYRLFGMLLGINAIKIEKKVNIF